LGCEFSKGKYALCRATLLDIHVDLFYDPEQYILRERSCQCDVFDPLQAKRNEEKIWEQIHAMRTIVGYKVAPQSSCAEELKALYIFTGVEPPASTKDSVDLTDISEKLHFLMSIIGVK